MDDNFNVIFVNDGNLRFHGFKYLSNDITVTSNDNGAVYIRNYKSSDSVSDKSVFKLVNNYSDDIALLDLLKDSIGYHFVYVDNEYYQSHISVKEIDLIDI